MQKADTNTGKKSKNDRKRTGQKAKTIRQKVKFGCAVRSSKKVKKIGPFYSSYTEVIRAGYNFIVSEFASYPQLIFHR